MKKKFIDMNSMAIDYLRGILQRQHNRVSKIQIKGKIR